MENYYLCSIQSKVNPNQNETVLVSVDEVSDFVSSTFVRTACLLFLSVQLLRLFLMKNETKSKIWAAVIAAAVSLLTSIAQIFS